VLKEWDKSTFIPPNKGRKSRLSEMEDIQQKIENEEVTQEALIRENKAYHNLHWILKSISLTLEINI